MNFPPDSCIYYHWYGLWNLTSGPPPLKKQSPTTATYMCTALDTFSLAQIFSTETVDDTSVVIGS